MPASPPAPASLPALHWPVHVCRHVAWQAHPIKTGTSRRGTDPPSSTSPHTRSVLEFAPALVPKQPRDSSEQPPGWAPLPLPRDKEQKSFTGKAPPMWRNHRLHSFAQSLPEPSAGLEKDPRLPALPPAQGRRGDGGHAQAGCKVKCISQPSAAPRFGIRRCFGGN